jgi:cytochrome P450
MKFDPAGKTFDEVYPQLEWVRKNEPAFFWEDQGVYVFTRYDDIMKILNDTENFTVEGVLETLAEYDPEATRILNTGVNWNTVPMPATVDGPDHTRLRAAFQKVLSPRRFKEVEPRVRAIARRLIADFANDGHCDFVTQFCDYFPMLAIFMLIGFDDSQEDMQQIRKWTDNMFKLWLAQLSPEEQVECANSAISIQNYIRAKIEDRRKNPRDDLMTELLQKIDEGEADISLDEMIVSYPISFIGAGYETTKAAIANGFYQLLRKPERWQQVLDNPKRIPEIAEECLRFDGPMLAWFRRVRNDTELAGMSMPKGGRVVLLYASANHDDAKFPEAEEFQAFRSKSTPHLTFSWGKHICLGAPLARMEMKIALEEMSASLPNLRLKQGQDIHVEPIFATRVLHGLELEWDLPPTLPAA